MKISSQLSDESLLKELGGRLAAARIVRNLTQAALAEQAGVSKRTVERLESGGSGDAAFGLCAGLPGARFAGAV
jgi:DNA-binding XRE family transcriptional regulator